MEHVDVQQRRDRLAHRHRLAPHARAADAASAASSVVALHATDAASVHLAAAARMATPTVAAVERALYDDRSLLRMLGMRRTVFVVPVDVAPVVQASSTRDIAAKERRNLIAFLANNDIADPEVWLRRVEAATLAALSARGEALASELREDVPELALQIEVGQGKWTGTVGVSTRVLFLLAADGHIVRGRPRGSWISSQYRWATAVRWLGAPLADLAPGVARADLVRRWLVAFGPGTVDDLKWWTGWTLTQTRAALSQLDVAEVDLGGATGVVLADDVAPVDPPGPWAALLPALDPTAMGYKERSWYLGPHRSALFDRSGNIGPTVWWGGRVVGGWAQRATGEVVHRLLEDVGADARTCIDAEVERLRGWVGDVRITPRFRTPLERELTG